VLLSIHGHSSHRDALLLLLLLLLLLRHG